MFDARAACAHPHSEVAPDEFRIGVRWESEWETVKSDDCRFGCAGDESRTYLAHRAREIGGEEGKEK